MKKFVRPLILIILLLIVASTATEKINKALHPPAPPPRTVLTRIGDISIDVSETGVIEPANKVDIKSKVAGRLLAIHIQEGQSVTRGQIIAVVDRTLIDPQIASTRAQLNQAQARLQQTIASYNLQLQQTQMAIAQAQANLGTAVAHLAAVKAGARPQELAQQEQAVERTQIALDDAKRTQKRKQDLLAKGFVSQSDADAAQVVVDTAASNLASAKQQLALTQAGPRVEDINDARAQVNAARVEVTSARANVLQNEVRRSDIAQAKANVEQISNQLAQLMVNVSDTKIIAPSSGIVLKKYKEVNEIVQSATTGFSDAQSIIATLGSQLRVQVDINEVDIPKVTLNAPVDIHVDSLPDLTQKGVVSSIAPASTNAFSANGAATGGSQSSISKFSVKIAFSRPDPRLRPGMSATVDILSRRHEHVVLAPREAIPFTGDQGMVMVLTAGQKTEQRRVALGLRNDTSVEVLSGLHAGERLVVPEIKGRRTLNIKDNGGGG